MLRNNPAAAAAAHSTAAAAAGFSSDGSRSSSVHIFGNDTVKSADEERASDGWPNETIFISMASYRDQECSKTVARAYLRAAHPHRVFFGIYQQQYTHTRAHIQTHTHAYTDAHLHARIPSNCSSGDSAVFPVPEVSDREGRRLDCLDCVANLGQTLGCPNHRACPHLWCDRMFPKREY